MRAGIVVWRPSATRWAVTICVKGTFSLSTEDPVLADDQEAILPDRYWAGDPAGSLWSPDDLVPMKPRSDFIVVGHAYAPIREAPSELVALASLGALTKRVTVRGDRRWQRSAAGELSMSQQPITAVPLRYERGARTAENPVGFDADETFSDDDARPEILDQEEVDTTLPIGAVAAPNLEPEAGAPCFGPMPLAWRSSRLKLSERAAAWAAAFSRPMTNGRFRVVDDPQPEGFDFAVFNAAPPELTGAELAPGAELVLEHMHRKRKRMSARIPAAAPNLFRGGVAIPLRCDTAFVDADHERLVLTWRAVVETTDVAAERFFVSSETAEGMTHVPEREDVTLRIAPESVRPPSPKSAPLGATQDVDVVSVRSATLPFEPPASVRVAPMPSPSAVAPTLELGRATLGQIALGAVAHAGEQAVSSEPRESVARYGAVSAALEADPTRRPHVLSSNGFSEASFARLERRVGHEIAEERAAGGDRLERSVDSARASARKRAPEDITPTDYAFVVVAVERGEIERALGALDVDLATLMRIQQVWRRRIRTDGALATVVDGLVAEERRRR